MAKLCLKCNTEKSTTLFSKDKKKKDGLNIYCRQCCAAASKQWQLANPEKYKSALRSWQSENLEKCQGYSKAWSSANPEKIAAKASKNRARKLNATPNWATSEQDAIKELYKQAKLLSEATGIEYHVDHIVPLTSNLVQGFHCLANLQILEAKANISKSNRSWPNMP